MTVLVTDRLVLRQWRDEDRAPFAAMNADPEVMRYFPAPFDRTQSDALLDRFISEWREGVSFHAVEEKATGRFVGFVGVGSIHPTIPIAPSVQVAWRLIRDVWGRGYAPEAARATIDLAFADEGLREVVAYTSTINAPSRRVMEKLGLDRAPERDFDHPALAAGDPLRRHVLYRISRADWLRQR